VTPWPNPLADGVEGFRSGDIPDPLIPWESQDVQPGRQRVAFVTIKVPENLLDGIYTAMIISENAGGVIGELPVTLEVFPFALPASRGFTP